MKEGIVTGLPYTQGISGIFFNLGKLREALIFSEISGKF